MTKSRNTEKTFKKATDIITQRVSISALTEPGISKKQLKVLMKAALRAPDYARLKPTRFILVKGKGRETLGKHALKALKTERTISKGYARKIESSFLRAPNVVIAVNRVKKSKKVTRDEQMLSTGAAVQNLMNAAFAMNIGAFWRTGEMANSPAIKRHLGLSDNESIAGFIYLGTPKGRLKSPPKAKAKSCLSQY